MARLKQTYQEKILPDLIEQFGYKSAMQAPRLTKLTINMGVGEAVRDKKILDHAISDLTQISGQKPQTTLAKKSVANFKIRDGWPIGCKVTLRRERMFEMMDRLISVAIPRIRDFRGFSPRSFDGHGNYSFGLKEQIVFPEIDYDRIDTLRGMDITLTTTANSDEEALALLRGFNFPIRS